MHSCPIVMTDPNIVFIFHFWPNHCVNAERRRFWMLLNKGYQSHWSSFWIWERWGNGTQSRMGSDYVSPWKTEIHMQNVQSITPSEYCLNHLLELRTPFGPSFPLMTKLAEIILSMPVSNAWPERGANAVKRIKNRLRNRLSNKMLETIMKVTLMVQRQNRIWGHNYISERSRAILVWI